MAPGLLPRARGWRGTATGALPPAPRSGRVAPFSTGCTRMAALLIVDVDRNGREALAIAARLEGLAVATAGSAAQAEALLAEGGFALLVVDCLVPGADALVRARAGRERILAVGHQPELLQRFARRHGVEALAKPIGPDDLRRRAAPDAA